MSAPQFKDAWLQPERGERIVLRGNFRIGRAPDNQLTINTANASRHHAAIHAQEPDEFWLLDLDSANGTFLNGHRLLRASRLRDGDRVMIGEATLVFRQAVTLAHDRGARIPSTATIVEFKEQPTWLLMADLKGFSEMCRNEQTRDVAVRLTAWFRASQRIIEQRGGRIGKYLGDGFLAYWTLADGGTEAVAETLRDLHREDQDEELTFRFVVHHGLVTFGAAASLGEGMMGTEINFTFRLEKLAAQLGLSFCLSAAAQEKLAPFLPTAPVDGAHDLKDFPDRRCCFQIIWP